MKVYDLAILGGGPGGYVAAIRAAQSGLSTCLIEKSELGGTCLNVGCIPTKYLLEVSSKFAGLEHLSVHGIETGPARLNMSAMIAGKNNIVQRLTNGVQYLLTKNAVEVFKGHGSFVNQHELLVSCSNGTIALYAENSIIATGSRPDMPAAFQYDGKLVCSSDEALDWLELPKHLIIVGGGVVGCEFATIFSNLGVDVTLVEILPAVLASFDQELAAAATAGLRQAGVTILTGNTIEQVGKRVNQVICHLNDGKVIKADKMLVTIGRKANLDQIGIENLGLRLNEKKRKIAVDARMQTSLDNIFAVGDVCSSPLDLAHVAMREGITAVANILMDEARMDYRCIPNCVYTQPEIAVVGMNESQATASGVDTQVGRFSFSSSGKALVMDEATGFVKIVADRRSGEIAGAQIIGPHATDLIAELAVLIQNRSSLDQLTSTVHAHPTLSEAVWEAAVSSNGHALHE